MEAGLLFHVDVISCGYNFPDSEISWLQFYMLVELSFKTAVSQLLAYANVRYFWPTCQPQHLSQWWNDAEIGRNQDNRALVKNVESQAL